MEHKHHSDPEDPIGRAELTDAPTPSTGDVLVIELAPYRGWVVRILKSEDNGEFYFRVDAGNGEPIYRTTETHPDRRHAERMAKLAAPYARLVPYRESD